MYDKSGAFKLSFSILFFGLFGKVRINITKNFYPPLGDRGKSCRVFTIFRPLCKLILHAYNTIDHGKL